MFTVYLIMRYTVFMRGISHKKIRDFSKKHAASKKPLEAWYKIIRLANFGSFSELRKIFASAVQVGKFTVFNIGGNKYRLISAIHYNRSILYIRKVLTHEEDNDNAWKEK
jgi:mRNA interferase HigB